MGLGHFAGGLTGDTGVGGGGRKVPPESAFVG